MSQLTVLKPTVSRRDFIKLSGALMGSGLLAACDDGMSAAPSNGVTPTPAPVLPLNIKRQNRALVYIMLAGGNDSFNMLVPTSAADYAQYRTSRSNLALDKSELLPLADFADGNGRTFGLHPSMTKVQQLFRRKQLSFVANCGSLVEPVTKQRYMNNAAVLPVGLMSHADQIRHWQTGNPGERVKYGWFGRYADNLQSNKTDQQIPMNISLSGSNIMQNGQQTFSYGIGQQGSAGLIVKENDPSFSAGQQALNDALLQGVNTMLNRDYSDPFKQTYAAMARHAQSHHETFKAATQYIEPQTSFSDSDLSQQLKMVARSIAASAELGMPQQTFFVEYLGWDHHDELLNNHQRMLSVLDNALGEFDTALNELGVADKTVTLVGSDFGRSLTSNGNGTDHGWGGNIMVMGDAIRGGQVLGDYPSLALNSSLDVGGGVLIPTTATDLVFAELSQWFGVDQRDLSLLFPNLPKFHTGSGKPGVGLIS